MGAQAPAEGRYGVDAAVAIETGDSAANALERAAAAAGLTADVEERIAASGKPRDRFAVAIKPNIMGARKREDAPSKYTDPALVEALAQSLRATGIADVAIVESRTDPNRGVAEAASALGYTTPVEDLTDDTVPFDWGGVIGEDVAGRAWQRADYRISFAKNKAQPDYFYSGAIANMFGVLPRPDKARHYSGAGHWPSESCRTALEALPVHFGFVDAWTSADRGGGRPTRAVLASPNVFALDWVMGEKMACDPALNLVVREALLRFGRIGIDRLGDLTPWEGWRAPSIASVALAGLVHSRKGASWTIQ